MPEPRLASGLWVAAYLARLRQAAIPAYLARRGDDTAGAVIVKLALLDGTARAFVRRWDFESDTRCWSVLIDGTEAEVDAALVREATRDRDLWLIEVEDRQGRSLLEDTGLNLG